jgi:threonine synthase
MAKVQPRASTAVRLPDLRCSRCGRTYPASRDTWRCECGGPLDLAGAAAFRPEAFAGRAPGVWRYREALPPLPDEAVVTLGEGGTPLIDARRGTGLKYKLEFLSPTGSFKDRGSTVLVSCLAALGVRRAVEDSSGNAGASMAAYFSAAGITCDLYIPATTSPAKTRQIRSHGARLVLIEGTRADVSRAAEAASDGAFYASHLWSPYFLAGTQTFGFEIWEQLGGRAPDAVVVPVGAGTLLLGAALGFRALRAAGQIERLPRIFGVQGANCAPLHYALRGGRESTEDVDFPLKDSMAEGIRIQRPPRDRQILAAVRESGGDIVTVSEAEIYAGWFHLAGRGLFVEPTAAVAAAAADRLLAEGVLSAGATTVVALTGTGLKGVATPPDAGPPDAAPGGGDER